VTSCESHRHGPAERAVTLDGGWQVHEDLYHWPLPKLVNLESTNDCNLRCTHCFHSSHDFPKGRLDPALIAKLEPVALNAGQVSLSGTGEPLLNRQFPEHLAWALSHGLKVFFTTHGHLLSRHLDHVVGKDIVITVSMDASTEGTYLRRRGTSWSDLLQNLRALQDAKAAAGTHLPELHFNFVAASDNVEDLPGLVDLAAEVGATVVTCFHRVCFTEEAYQLYSLHAQQERFDAVLVKAVERARATGVFLAQPGTFDGTIPMHEAAADYLAGTQDDFHCHWIESITTINWNGIVQSCCFSDRMLMGNMAHDTFEDVWNGPEYRALRLSHARNVYPQACRECIFQQVLSLQDKGSFLSPIVEEQLYRDDLPPQAWKVSELDPLYRRARDELRAGKTAASLPALEQLRSRSGDLFEAANALAVAHALGGRVAEARSAFAAARDAHPGSELIARNLSRLGSVAEPPGVGG
jgi:radical SAM protein with 4Fe4S-binding SPASM domain